MIHPLMRRLGLPMLLLLTMAGCGHSGPTLVDVAGTVNYRGKPLPGIRVLFTPQHGPMAIGTTDAAGRFRLSTIAPHDGVVPGKHKVAIAPNTTDHPPAMPGTPEAAREVPKPPPFPARYGDAEKSGLTADVKADETNDFTFEIKDE